MSAAESERATATSNAWFDSHCPNCSHPILARDQIGLVEGEWLCSGCYDTDTADDPDGYRDLIVDAQLGVR